MSREETQLKQEVDEPNESQSAVSEETNESVEQTRKSMVHDAERARRRRLLKGIAAGVPAVMTLQSGSALAGSTTTCVQENGSASSPGTRCVISDTTGNGDWKRGQESAYFGGIAFDGDGASDAYCMIYVNSDGTEATSAAGGAGNYGGDGGTTSNPVAGYYAITNTCWSSFT
ncbi:MAG: hypothetical protein HQL50_13150 [Magnetococcales bacterium]|nr:hypothetical protein [Magnetococcales bacterium]